MRRSQFSTSCIRAAKLCHSAAVGDIEGFHGIVEDKSVITEFE